MSPPGMSMGAAPPPGADPLAAAIVGAPGVDPHAPSAMGPPSGIPPELAAMAMPGAGQPAGPMYPTTDPQVMAQALSQILSAQQLDQGAMAMDQQSALMNNPIMSALMSGAPMGPGAGQDGQAIGAPTGDLPMPPDGMGGTGMAPSY